MSSETHKLNDETREMFNKVLNRVLKKKYDWFKGIVIKSLSYKESRAIYLAITADIYIDSEWGYNQWLRYNYTKQFPFGEELSFGEIVGGNLSEELQDNIFKTFLVITGVGAQRLSFEWFDVHLIDSENKELHENIHRIKQVMGLLVEEQKKYSTIIVLGPQGVGKSTITELLGEKLKMPVISSDDYVNQGDWVTEKNRKEGWLKRKENEFSGTIKYLKTNLGKPVILDIGGSHGVWEGEQLKQILSMISKYPNRFLILPTKDTQKSKEFLRSRLLKREMGMEDAIKYWEAIIKGDESFAKDFTPEDKKEFMKHLENAKNGNDRLAKYNIDRMQKRLDIINSGNVNWREFDIDDEDAPMVKFRPDEFEDYSEYFIKNMKSSGIGNHIIYNLGKDNEKIMDEIVQKLI